MAYPLTQDQFDALCQYIRERANELCLRDWTLIVKRDPPDIAEAYGQVEVTYGRRRALIWFCTDFYSLSPEDQRHVVIHELLHVVFDEPAAVVRDLNTILGNQSHEIVSDNFRRAVEHSIDALADAIAPSYPLIAWPDTADDGLAPIDANAAVDGGETHEQAA